MGFLFLCEIISVFLIVYALLSTCGLSWKWEE